MEPILEPTLFKASLTIQGFGRVAQVSLSIKSEAVLNVLSDTDAWLRKVVVCATEDARPQEASEFSQEVALMKEAASAHMTRCGLARGGTERSESLLCEGAGDLSWPLSPTMPTEPRARGRGGRTAPSRRTFVSCPLQGRPNFVQRRSISSQLVREGDITQTTDLFCSRSTNVEDSQEHDGSMSSSDWARSSRVSTKSTLGNQMSSIRRKLMNHKVAAQSDLPVVDLDQAKPCSESELSLSPDEASDDDDDSSSESSCVSTSRAQISR
eukprot:gb/GFBE01023521.1/.p1 GENE.gb/GFBE01023521.1/~~gb/GFBE01023521.1/.p1  ORF type:complete len:268 (+),score=24.56 gb/GFBE01023521.1/:1-804(+)